MRIDLDIGEMNFVFTRSVWNPQSHEYSTFTDGAWDGYDGENNRIRITNRSNREIRAEFSANIDFPVNLGGLEGIFSESPDQTESGITDITIDRAQEGGPGAEKEVYFYFSKDAPQMEESSYYVPIGTITVKFEPGS
ncbi:hypothetical protein [Clostridium sp. Marseille-P3244]|uniref:hypothetical protein n=1 Tax=Clostridium sp. Marseille-P3244 TaxID=1871020 RepID=UPI0013566C31|nr:hypothetical protein [Clostridium sp. Marseille-P3244]